MKRFGLNHFTKHVASWSCAACSNMPNLRAPWTWEQVSKLDIEKGDNVKGVGQSPIDNISTTVVGD